MHDDLKTFSQKPTQKFCEKPNNFEKPQIFNKNQKFRSKNMKCMMNEWKRDIPEVENAHKDRRTLGLEVWSERERFWKVKRQKGSREIEKSEAKIMLTH